MTRSTYIIHIVCMLFISIYTGTLTGAAPAETAPNQTTWQDLCKAPDKPINYYYTLLNITENELIDKNTLEDRAALLASKMQTRFAEFNDDATMADDNKLIYRRELQRAHQLFANNAHANIYRIVGHNIYLDIESKGLLAYFQTIEDDILLLRKIAHLNMLLVQGLGLEQAMQNIVNAPAEIQREDEVYNRLDDNRKKVYDALGRLLYNEVAKNKNDLNTLTQELKDKPESTPADILKNYILLLQCKFAIAAEKNAATSEVHKDDTPRDDTARKNDAIKTDKPRTPLVGGKAKENIEKANTKLESAIRTLKNAKRNIKNKDDRESAKQTVTNALLDYEEGLKQMADKIKKAAAAVDIQKHEDRFPPLAKFVYLVEDLYKEAKNF